MKTTEVIDYAYIGVEFLRKEAKAIDEQLAKMLETDEANKRTIEILESVKGVGTVTISTIVANLPKLSDQVKPMLANKMSVLS